MCSCRSSLPNVFLGKGILKICNKFTEYPCRSVISIKLQSNVIEIALRHGCPPVNLLWKWGVKETPSTFFLQSCDSWMSVKENPDRKKRISTLREKCPNKEFFWSVFFRTRAEYGDLFRKSPYSARVRENTDQKNYVFGYFSRSPKVVFASLLNINSSLQK